MMLRLALCAVLALAGGAQAQAVTGALDVEALPPTLNGVWKSNGYGVVVAIKPEGVNLFHVAGVHCLPVPEESGGLFDAVDTFALSTDGRRLTLSASVEPHPYQLDRIETLPAACATPPANTPLVNFEAFSAVMAEHYAFFELHGVDWRAATRTARDRIQPDMSDAALFEVLTSMLAGLKDGHLSLAAELDGERRVFEANDGPSQIRVLASAAEGENPRARLRAWRSHYWDDDIGRDILGGQGVETANKYIRYGVTSDDIGYIAALTVGGYADRSFGDPLADAAALDVAMEEALARFEAAKVKAVIVDLSINFGGFDFIARKLASRFAAAPAFVYAKGPGDAARPYTTRISMSPAEGRRFTGPVYVLTSDAAVSGGEILTMALRALPNVTHVGAPTRGALSDVLGVTLPNGWVLTLSNEVYTDHDGVLWEGRGVHPQRHLDVFPADDMDGGHLKAVEALIAMIDAEH